MDRHERLQSAVFAVFGSSNWASENIKTIPQDFTPDNLGEEFIRVSIVPGGHGLNILSLSGVLMIDIFTLAGQGPNRKTQIVDKLESYLVGKCLAAGGNDVVQFGNSSLKPSGLDRDNPALTRSTLTIPFDLFGV